MTKEIRIGGPVFGLKGGIEEQVQYHLDHGWAAAYCPIIDDTEKREKFKQAFKEADIVLSEVGGYCINILDQDEKTRKKNVDDICKKLEYAEQMEALCLVIHCGTIEKGGWGKNSAENISQECFDKNVKALKDILEEVNPVKTKLTLEFAAWTFPYNPETYLELINAVGHPALAVHLDPQNIIDSPVTCYENAKLLKKCFNLLGKYITSCHSKDIVLKNVYLPLEITETYTGNGILDLEVYVSELASIENDAPLMIEHLNKKQLPKANQNLFEACKRANVKVKHGEKRKS